MVKLLIFQLRACVYFHLLRFDFSNLNGEKFYKPAHTYYQNKLALLLLSKYLSEKQANIKIQAVRVSNVKIDINIRYPNFNSFFKIYV